MSDSNKLVEVAPLSRLKIRNISMALREAIRLPNNQAFPIAYFIENMLIDLDPKFEFYILEDLNNKLNVKPVITITK